MYDCVNQVNALKISSKIGLILQALSKKALQKYNLRQGLSNMYE